MIFIKEFKPKKIKKCDTEESRKRFLNKENKNLNFLLEERFLWMKKYLKNKNKIIELGSGNGASKSILKNKKIILTDIQKYPWISKKIDMNKLNIEKKYKNKIDVFILNQSLHHCANPSKLLSRISYFLKKDGFILIREPEISFFLKFFLIILDDEAFSLNVDIFNHKKNIFNPNNVYDANNATPYLLFKNEEKFHENFPQYQIIHNRLSEFFIFINSGGVVQKTFFIPVNKFFFKVLSYIDKVIIFFLPNIFALGRTVVLKKK